MPTVSEISQISNRIYNSVVNGTPTNPNGLPPVLASLVLSQAKHETDNFSSNVFRTDNNGFGYKWTGNDWQAGKGLPSPEGDNYAHYIMIEDSAREIVDWIYRRRKEGIFPQDLSSIRTPEQYAALLKKTGYYGDSLQTYTAGLKKWFSRPTNTGAVLIGILGIYWLMKESKILSKILITLALCNITFFYK